MIIKLKTLNGDGKKIEIPDGIRSEELKAENSGILVPRIPIPSQVKKGDIIANIHEIYKLTIYHEMTAFADGIITELIGNEIYKGDTRYKTRYVEKNAPAMTFYKLDSSTH